MKNSWLIALREWKERIAGRSFLLACIFGPLIVLGLTYLLFAYGGKTAVKWNVLVADPSGILENKIMPRPDTNVRFFIANDYIKTEDFAQGKKFQNFDALVEINEKVLSNKVGFVFYRELPAKLLERKLDFVVQRRLEEILVKRFTDLSAKEFRKIKQPVTLNYRNVYDPEGLSSDKKGWVGVFFGALIFVFIALFGMTVLRGVSRDKSNRIVEIMLSTVKPFELMLGKILGIGMAAMVQFTIWIAIISLGLMWMRQTLFPNYVDSNLQSQVINEEKDNFDEDNYEYNEFVDLVYERIQFGPMLTAFAVFFVLGFFFYAAVCAGIGAAMGSESDGQQFVIPLLILMCFGAYSGYYVYLNPSSDLAGWLQFIPFTAPSVVMVKLAVGYELGSAYLMYASGILLFLSAILTVGLSARIYKNGLLHFGHRLTLSRLLKWMKKSQ